MVRGDIYAAFVQPRVNTPVANLPKNPPSSQAKPDKVPSTGLSQYELEFVAERVVDIIANDRYLLNRIAENLPAKSGSIWMA